MKYRVDVFASEHEKHYFDDLDNAKQYALSVKRDDVHVYLLERVGKYTFGGTTKDYYDVLECI